MKFKLLSFFMAVVVALAFTSCDSIKGSSSDSSSSSSSEQEEATLDPEQDAEAFQELLEKRYELMIQVYQTGADYIEYYAENEDMDAWQDLKDEIEDLNDDYYNQQKDLKEDLEKVEKKLIKNRDTDDDEDDDY
ncbi:MAG: hypothetical protein IKW85_12195 [Muribaculaceae bacterium]|nr:hypothetical protein [Muribaculaceae bacterium]